jgi:hypothetical protein
MNILVSGVLVVLLIVVLASIFAGLGALPLVLMVLVLAAAVTMVANTGLRRNRNRT